MSKAIMPIASAPSTPFLSSTREEAKSATLLRLAEASIRKRLQALLKNEEGAREGTNIEALHDLRVASRRLREALRIYAPLLPRKRARQAIADARRITRALGTVREVDVNLEQLKAWQARLGNEMALPLESLVALELSERRRLRKRMLARLDQVDLKAFGDEILDVLDRARSKDRRNPEGILPSPGVSLVSWAQPHIEEGLQNIQRTRERLALHGTDHNLHLLRIHTKRFRYAVELLAPAFQPRRAGRILKQLKRLQDELGELHDCVVLHDRLRRLRAEFRQDQLSHLDQELLRFMRIIAREKSRRKTLSEKHLRQLERRAFFDSIAGALKESASTARSHSI